MSRSDDSESESSEGSRRREKSPAASPKRHRRSSPQRPPPPLARNVMPRPRFSTMLSQDQLAMQQHEMFRRNLPPLVGPDPGLTLPITILLEQKFALQQLEIQRLLSDNQQLAATHISLRQDLAAMQEQLQRRRDMSLTETDKDEQIRALVERISKQELDLRAMGSLKDDLEKLLMQRQELSLKAQADALQLALLKSQIDGLHNELQHARISCEQERKVSADHLLHRQAMERSYHSVLEEVGRLRIELANLESKSRGVPTGPPATANYGSLPVQSYDTGNNMQQKPWGYSTQQSMSGQDPMPLMNRQPYYADMNITPAGLSNGPSGSSQEQVVHTANDSTAGQGWSTHTASNGQQFYYNSVTGATQWEKPFGMTSEDQYRAKFQMQPVQQENAQHPMQFSASRSPAVSEPNQFGWSAQTNTHAHNHYVQTPGQIPPAGVPAQNSSYPEQVAAQASTSQS